MYIYLAGPITGLGYNEIVDRYLKKITFLNHFGYNCLCPMTGKTHLRNEVELKGADIKTGPTSTNHAIFERDRWMVSKSDIVLADLTTSGNRVSIGTVMELAWASQLGKHTIVVMDESNIHRHAFIIESADVIFTDLKSAFTYLVELSKNSL